MMVLQWIAQNKLVTFISVALLAFTISTIVVAVQKTDKEQKLEECLLQLSEHETDTATEPSDTTTTIIPTTTEGGGGSSTTTESNLQPEGPAIDYRLPSNAIPRHYNLKLEPDLEEDVFLGVVKIDVDVLSETDQVVLHTNGLVYENINITHRGTEELVDSRLSYELVTDDREFLILNLEPAIPSGGYSLTLQFSGNLKNGIVGLYSSTISTAGNEIVKMAASKFQPTYARQAFPCFDEPHFKATFDIHLVRPTEMIALSNMEEIASSPYGPGTVLVTFNTSVAMSTYLAVFVVCDFDYEEVTIDTSGYGGPFQLRNFAQSDQLDKIQFALGISKNSVEYFIEYFQHEYPLPKLDQIAIPDYVSGATEHWGLVTYRETSFLIDPVTSSSLNRRNVATTIAHELAHMWFGNLVTMMWWDETWLNEGFATYMAYKCLQEIEPTWSFMSSFPSRVLHSVLSLDATHASHPIVMDVKTPDEITSIFDTISYNKGASVLRMLDHFIGLDDFRNGISKYLEKFQFNNTVTQDLLDVLAVDFEAANPNLNLNLTHIMATWTKQMGYPVVTVSYAQDVVDGNSNQFIITQKRFLTDPSSEGSEASEYNYRWFIPLTYKTNLGSDYNIVWFPDDQESVTITVNDPDFSWVMLNREQIGYYRVNYANQLWLNLIDILHNSDSSESLSPEDRGMLINDAYSLADAGEADFAVPLNLTQYLTVERDWAPWSTAISRFNVLQRRLQDSLGYSPFRRYITSLLVPIYSNLTWTPDESTNENVLRNILRSDILSFACSAGYAPALDQAVTSFKSWLTSLETPSPENVHPDLKTTVYVYGIQGSGEQEWWKVWEIYLNENDAQEKARYIQALTSTRDVNLLRSLLNLAWNEAYVRSQDQISLIQQVAANPSGTAITWEHVREQWPRLVDRFTLNSRVLGGMIPSITSSFSTQIKLNEAQSFFMQYPEAGAGVAGRAQSLENIQNNIVWRLQHENTIVAWLNNNYS